ncbi:RNA exonuclease ASCRUDRAFT_31232 [Ascoidea rubescens DSM 1968]|uniref:Uncharacterized protein n=1 Tax=Ascoidea rubescens DSM 1968 TaxID=1344418 RepID=A0A1D2VNJ9_9ASCO|nr:hypothetical protein ASCRUDRAFT_31232 [Ascoidea rubescens DSM 1968]ODV63169.1 hypothetical protein ASCRUDRAFT_31232 [Ascoidea rubescens DSM 1968]
MLRPRNALFQHRAWVPSLGGATATSCADAADTFNVLSYNLLFRHYVHPSTFGYVKKQHLDWRYRFGLINQIILGADADIMCFQEMECSVYQNYWKDQFLKRNYDSIYLMKHFLNNNSNIDITKNEMDGLSIFINSDKFKVLNVLPLNFQNFFNKSDQFIPFLKNKSNHSLFNHRVTNRNQIAIVLLLKNIKTNHLLIVLNTHLYWNPKFNDTKLFQLLSLVSILKDYSSFLLNKTSLNLSQINNNNKQGFNLNYNFNDYNPFNNLSSDPYAHILQNPFNFSSAYNELYFSHSFPYTSFTNKLKGVFDYIFYSSNDLHASNNCFHLKLSHLLGPISPNYCFQNNAIPNKHFPSDHLPLLCQFHLGDFHKRSSLFNTHP